MKIKIGKVFKNKTIRYLAPMLKKHYDNLLIGYLKSIGILAIGVGDFLMDKSYKQHLFILIDVRFNTKVFQAMLEYIFDKQYYETHYPFDNIITGRMHMIVLKLPNNVVEDFLHGKYSKLYEEEALDFIKDTEVLQVITKNSEYKVKFVENIKKEFQAIGGAEPLITLDDIDDGREYDTPPEKKNEFFNYREPV